MKPTCSTCKFWDEKHTSCHAHPPTHDGWPHPCMDDWCGEHQPEGIAAQPGEDVLLPGTKVYSFFTNMRQPASEPDESIFGQPQEARALIPGPDATLPPRLREAYTEIAESEGGGQIGYTRASRAYLAAKRIFRAPTPAQMLATYRTAADSGALDSPPSLWPDFRKKMAQERRQERTGSIAPLDDERRSAFQALDAKLDAQ